MRQVAVLTVALYLALGAAAWSAWVVRCWAARDLTEHADTTSRLVWWSGQVLVWAGAVVVGGALAGAAASVVWKAAVGP